MHRAVTADELGPIENYSLRSRESSPLAPDQVRIAVKAAGVSFADVLMASGRYQYTPPVPFVPGSEFAGVVEETGADVGNLSVGQSVLATSLGGAFAESVAVAAAGVQPMPENMSFEMASVFKVSLLTAWHGIVDRGHLSPREILLVLGAGGATGHAAVQVGKYLGARVIASASSEDKRAAALGAGADAAVEAGSPGWREDVKRANDGRAVDVVFDPVGGDSTEVAFRILAPGGRHLVVGFPRGIPSLPTNLALLKGASLVGVYVNQLDPRRAGEHMNKLCALASHGLFHPRVAETLPLERFAEAMRLASEGRTAGRIVLVMD